jgi:hypothetical protein
MTRNEIRRLLFEGSKREIEGLCERGTPDGKPFNAKGYAGSALEGLKDDIYHAHRAEARYSPRRWLGRRPTASESVQFSRESFRMRDEGLIVLLAENGANRTAWIRLPELAARSAPGEAAAQ